MLFSIVIPTYNEERNIEKLLRQIDKYCAHYSREIIIIDCGSTDKTVANIQNNIPKIRNLKLVQINKNDFNHGLTRNLGVSLARGEYICFFSADISLSSHKIFDYFICDFKLDKRVVAIFGKHIPYKNCSISHKLDIISWFGKFDIFTRNGILIQDRKKPFVPCIDKNTYLWWPLANTFTCYKRTFLLKEPFIETNYGEDYSMGKQIIESDLIKIYDSRCVVLHSHSYGFFEYSRRLYKDFNLKYGRLKMKEPNNLLLKIRILFAFDISFLHKIQYSCEIIAFYFIKAIIFTLIRVRSIFSKA